MPKNRELGAVDADSMATGGPNQTAITASLPNALAEGKPLADDGELYSTVQDAENAASSWVFVPPGTFTENVTISTAGLTLEGSGENTLIDGGSSDPAIYGTVNNITVKNLSATTTGSGSPNTIKLGNSANSSVESVHVSSAGHHGIVAGDDGIVKNCRVEDTGRSGVRVGVRGVISSNIAKKCAVGGPGTAIIPRDDGIACHNIIANSHAGLAPLGPDCLYVGNRVFGSSDSAILVNNDDVVVANNRCDGNIEVNASGVEVDGNIQNNSSN